MKPQFKVLTWPQLVEFAPDVEELGHLGGGGTAAAAQMFANVFTALQNRDGYDLIQLIPAAPMVHGAFFIFKRKDGAA